MKDPSSLREHLEFREVTAANWHDFEALFECRGGPKACWCMVWRTMPGNGNETLGASRKAAMRQRILQGDTVGLLGYLDDEPVVWCSIAPRSTYRRLTDDNSSDEGIWSLACMFVIRRLRGQGLSQRTINAAIVFAKSKGARIVEAYPVAPDSPSYRFMGFVPMFEAAGFHEIGVAGRRRHVFQLNIK